MTLLRGAPLLTGVHPLSPIAGANLSIPAFLTIQIFATADGRGSNPCRGQLTRRQRTIHNEGEHS